MARRFAAGVGAAAVVVAVAGCSSAPAPAISSSYNPTDPQTWSFEQVIDQALGDAKTGGANAAQLDELATAQKNGMLSVEQLRNATEAVRECLAEAGATVSAISESSHLGQLLPTFTYEPPAGVAHETFDNTTYSACETQHRTYVSHVYSNQPAAREALGTALTAHEDQLKQCLKDMGGEGVNELTLNELWEALKAQSFGGADYGYSQEKDCIIDSGINW